MQHQSDSIGRWYDCIQMKNICLSRRIALSLGLSEMITGLARHTATAAPTITFPQPGDGLVLADGQGAGHTITLSRMVQGDPPLLARAVDPATGIARDPARFGLILIVRLDPARLSVAATPFCVDGTAAFSAICTHAGCTVSDWNVTEQQFFCPCHRSVFDPAFGGRVVAGPAPRPLPVLPLRTTNGALTAAAGFSARIGGSTGRTD